MIKMIKSQKINLHLLMVLCFSFGVFASLLFQFFNQKDYIQTIYYVSQEELMDIEKKRVEELEEGERNLFYGRIAEVFEYMEYLVKNYESRGMRLVLSKGEVIGNNVESLSKKTHTEILRKIKDN